MYLNSTIKLVNILKSKKEYETQTERSSKIVFKNLNA